MFDLAPPVNAFGSIWDEMIVLTVTEEIEESFPFDTELGYLGTHGIPYRLLMEAGKPVYVEKNILKESLRKKIRSLPLPNTICLILILWTLFVFVVVNDLEIYIILLFIGILISREITDQYISNTYKMKLNIYILIFLVTYIILISQKIIQILQP